ncbi:MAG TPA: ATP-dependent sacrificial sulfur transferase LarE [bacterium]|nr:ATP-dependent sacrificial sulfur transferase LarE [bacterium]
MPSLAERHAALLAQLRAGGSGLVAFSGGVDSSLLLALARTALGRERVLAVTVDSPFVPRAELAAAQALAVQLDAPWEALAVDTLTVPALQTNPADRCYHCKKMLYCRLREIATARGLAMLLDGSNADDANEVRPGARAKAEVGAISPLQDARLTKAEVRALAREHGLPNADAPAQACLATRFPTGVRLTREGLRRVEQAESAVRAQGFHVVRVRDYFPCARVEVGQDELARARQEWPALAAKVQEFGYQQLELDPHGYRCGSMNG